MMRRALIGAGALGALLALSGCTVEPGGVAAIGVDEHGLPIGYVKMCGARVHIDGGTLYADDNSEAKLGTWEAPQPVTDRATWSLSDGSPWHVKYPLASLESGHTNELYGWSNDASHMALHVAFTTDALAKLKPGQVLYWSGKAASRETVTATVDEFYAKACDLVGG